MKREDDKHPTPSNRKTWQCLEEPTLYSTDRSASEPVIKILETRNSQKDNENAPNRSENAPQNESTDIGMNEDACVHVAEYSRKQRELVKGTEIRKDKHVTILDTSPKTGREGVLQNPHKEIYIDGNVDIPGSSLKQCKNATCKSKEALQSYRKETDNGENYDIHKNSRMKNKNTKGGNENALQTGHAKISIKKNVYVSKNSQKQRDHINGGKENALRNKCTEIGKEKSLAIPATSPRPSKNVKTRNVCAQENPREEVWMVDNANIPENTVTQSENAKIRGEDVLQNDRKDMDNKVSMDFPENSGVDCESSNGRHENALQTGQTKRSTYIPVSAQNQRENKKIWKKNVLQNECAERGSDEYVDVTDISDKRKENAAKNTKTPVTSKVSMNERHRKLVDQGMTQVNVEAVEASSEGQQKRKCEMCGCTIKIGRRKRKSNKSALTHENLQLREASFPRHSRENNPDVRPSTTRIAALTRENLRLHLASFEHHSRGNSRLRELERWIRERTSKLHINIHKIHSETSTV